MLLMREKILGAAVWIILVSSFRITNARRLPRQVAISFAPTPAPVRESCLTPADPTGGSCTVMFSCSYFFDTLKSGDFDSSFLDILRRSICRYEGGTPIVCCPNFENKAGALPAEPPSPTPTPEPEVVTTTQEVVVATETPVVVETEPPTTETSPPQVLRGADFLPDKCGTKLVTSTRITGGRPAPKGAWPWIATLGYRIGGKLEFLCGATLLTSFHIVTASHCLEDRTDLEVIRLGEHDLNKATEVVHEDYGIAKRIMHERYNSRTFENDIAIVKLDREVIFKPTISPCCLPQSSFFINNDLVGIRAFVAGWGAIQFNSISSNVLKEAMVPVRSNGFCDKAYENFTNIIVDEKRLCAGEGGNDACQGDSGGPLVAFDPTDRKHNLIGVVSVGYKCADPKFPGIYTRVSAYIDWIISNLD